MKAKWLLSISMVVALTGGLAVHAADIGTGFSYQGFLEKPAGTPVDGVSCDFRFGLWDAAAGGNQQGVSPQTKIGVAVTGGVFTVPDLDFGAGAIDGAARWLEIEVQCPPDAGFTLLSPRVELTPAPHAIRAWEGVGPPNALEVDTATGFVGIGTDSPVYPLHSSTAGPSDRAVYGEATAATGTTYGVFGRSVSPDGAGVRGDSVAISGTAYGGRFQTGSPDGRAVYGEAIAAGGTAYGVFGRSNSTSGRGVYGEATAGTGSTYGGWFQSLSADGAGVFGSSGAISGTAYGGRFQTGSPDGRAVYGEAIAGTGTAYGVYGRSDSTDGRGVYGEATAATGGTYGGSFRSDSTEGRAVQGWATAASGNTIGGRFTSDSTAGYGVWADADASTGTTYGVVGRSASTDGYGVFGYASAANGTTRGGYFKSQSTDGFGVYGLATAITGTNYGVYGRSDSTEGRAVQGWATAASGNTIGGRFTSDSTSGYGVWADADASTGTTYGVVGRCNSPDGFAGYFTGPAGSRNYFAQSVGIGTNAPDVTLHVEDGADASLSSGSGYLVLGPVSGSNLVLDNNEILARNNGAGASLFINYEGGNVGILRNSASHPLHVGNDSSTGNGAHLTAGGIWTNGSDRNSKENFKPFDAGAILEKVAELPLTVWNYIGETDGVHHIGPMAQDFHAAFGLGHDERYITTIDADGVALAAIQGLYQIVQEKDCEIEELKAKAESVERLEEKVAALEALVHKLAAQNGGGR